MEEQIYSSNNPSRLIPQLHILKSQYNELSSNQAIKSLWRLKQNYYEQGERAGKLLAWHIKQLQSERAINAIEGEDGHITVDPEEINN